MKSSTSIESVKKGEGHDAQLADSVQSLLHEKLESEILAYESVGTVTSKHLLKAFLRLLVGIEDSVTRVYPNVRMHVIVAGEKHRADENSPQRLKPDMYELTGIV